MNNRYEKLSEANAPATEDYEHFLLANKEKAKEIIPQRKIAKREHIPENTNRETKKRQQYFSKLLGGKPTAEGDLNINIPPVLFDLQTRSDSFSKETCVKENLIFGQAVGPVRITTGKV